MAEDLIGPSLNCALIRAVWPSGALGPKATGVLIGIEDELYLLTNWHVATGRRWQGSLERGEEPQWASESTPYSPRALRISIRFLGEHRVLEQLEIEDDTIEDDGPRYAWDSQNAISPAGLLMPDSDVVCLHVGNGLRQLEGRLSVLAQRRIRVGYDYWETGLDHGPAVGDRVFVVGYPRDIGSRATDPPVWTGGTIATDPVEGWEGPRFLIDARTRDGQSGSAVIAYAPAAGGLPAQYQLLGLYSGRLDVKADIGFVWHIDELIEGLATRSARPRPVAPSGDLDTDKLMLNLS